MQTVSLRSSVMRRILTSFFDFSLSVLLSFLAFLASFFVSLAGHLVGFILAGKDFRKFLELCVGGRTWRFDCKKVFTPLLLFSLLGSEDPFEQMLPGLMLYVKEDLLRGQPDTNENIKVRYSANE